MFRIGLKFPCNGVNRVKKHYYSRVYLTARYYETRARVKCEPEARLCKDVKLTSRFPGHKYSTDSSRSDKSRGGGVVLTLGAITIGTIGILAYAKSNQEFRATLEGWIPGTDRTIQIIFQEENTYFEALRAYFESHKQTLLSLIFGENKEEKKEIKTPGQGTASKLDCTQLEDYIPPKPSLEPLVTKKDPPVNEPYAEIRVSKEKEEKIEVVAPKPSPPPKHVPQELMPANLVELETFCGEAASKAIAAYQQATCAIQDYNRDVIQVVESAGSAVDKHVWERLKEATQKRKAALQEAEQHANEALNSLKRMASRIDDPNLEAPPPVKVVARRNIKKILDDVDGAKKKYDQELQSSNITERYWKQVKASRECFNEELQILFPSVNINEKKLSVNEDAFDLFVLHMYYKINYLQKELEKLQTIHETKIKSLMRASGEDVSQDRINSLIDLEVDKEKRALQDEFSKKLLAEQRKFDEELRRQLKLQSQVHADHLREALSVKEKENQRTLNRALSEQAEEQSTTYKQQLAAIVGRLRGLDAALKARLEEEKGACNAQLLWSACQALARAVKAAPPGLPAEIAVRPLEPEIKAVCKAAPKGDPLVRAAIEGIPEEASKRGVFPEDTLRERFLKVEKMAKKLALVPEQGASLPIYLLSYLQSFLIIDNVNPISKSELEDEPVDLKSLNTYDVLHRARYWLDRGDFKMTLRYMNLLKGAPRCIARDWMNEARILLETQQAIDTLVAYAGATGLIFLGEGDDSSKQTKK